MLINVGMWQPVNSTFDFSSSMQNNLDSCRARAMIMAIQLSVSRGKAIIQHLQARPIHLAHTACSDFVTTKGCQNVILMSLDEIWGRHCRPDMPATLVFGSRICSRPRQRATGKCLYCSTVSTPAFRACFESGQLQRRTQQPQHTMVENSLFRCADLPAAAEMRTRVQPRA